MSLSSLIQAIRDQQEDYEFYPTSKPIIQAIQTDALKRLGHRHSTYCEQSHQDVASFSVLDIGAGDGRVLTALSPKGKKYAIEKSRILIDAMPNNIFIVGTDFTQQTLIDKRVDLIFSNPPYSEFTEWATKIIAEANAPHAYLVLPKRWSTQENIQQALKKRSAKTEVIGSFDFLDADRKARAKVDIIYIQLCGHGWNSASPRIDPFRLWFKDFFKLDIQRSSASEWDIRKSAKNQAREQISNALVSGSDLSKVLENLYRHQLDELIATYQSLANINTTLLEELNVDYDGVLEALKLKISSLKDVYWHELFSNLTKITDKLCSRSRDTMLKVLNENTHVDFSASNAYAVVSWAIKNANGYFDRQLIELVEFMVSAANIVNYQSNQRTFGREEWRYNRRPTALSHYALEYRIVVENSGGLCTASWHHEKTPSGLSNRCADFLNDIRTVASNLGYSTEGFPGAHDFEWRESKGNKIFKARDLRKGRALVLFEARAFKNGNVHLKLDQGFMMRLNCEMGRLKGWLKTPIEASEELGIPPDIASTSFGSNYRLDSVSRLQLGFEPANDST